MVEILHAAAAVTPEGIVHNAELRFDGDRIAYVGPRESPAETATVLNDCVLMPGLVNAHTHSAMTLFRGVDDDHGFMPWLQEVQALEQHLTHEDVRAGLELAMLEMIASGTVAFADMYVWDASLLERVREAGMRVFAAVAVTAPEVNMFPGVSPHTGRGELEAAVALAASYADDPQVRVGFGPHAPYSVTPEFFSEIIALARKHRLPIHTHIAESPAESADIQQRYGASPAAHLGALGLFDTDLLAAHCVHLSDGEIADFAAHGVAVAHNPVSNLKLGNGVAPLTALCEHGVRVGLGTDSVASNNSLDLFEEIKLATLLQRGVAKDAAAMQAARVLELACNGDAIGFPDTGALAPGKHADVIAVRVPDVHNVVSQLVFATHGEQVRRVWIGGRAVYCDGEFLTLDAADIRARAAAATARLRAASASAS